MGAVNLAWPLAIALSLAASGAQAWDRTAVPSAPRVVNVTTDSAPGWIPSEALEAEAGRAVQSYFRAFDKGDDRALWNFASDGLQSLTSFSQFESANKRMRSDLGRLKRFVVLRVTWTKDPAEAPAPGIYVAIDVAGQFSKSKRHCGYLVLYKAAPDDAFRLARIENNFMTDAMAKKITADKSTAEVTRLWSVLSANCPNYQAPVGLAK